jgi:hypothetical protein
MRLRNEIRNKTVNKGTDRKCGKPRRVRDICVWVMGVLGVGI